MALFGDNDDAFGELAYEDERGAGEKDMGEEVWPELSEDENDGEEEGKLKVPQEKERGGNCLDDLANRKRGPRESVFSNYSPIDWHLRIGEEEQAAKRRRTMVEEAVGRATMRILSARMAANQPKKLKRTEERGTNETELPSEIRQSKLLKLPPMNGQMWWGINSVDSATRRYLSIRRRERGQILINGQREEEDDSIFHAKLMEAEERAREWEMQRLEAVQQKEQGGGADEDQMAMDGEEQESHENRQQGSAVLWTDKYVPKSFLELLTEDESNRITLLWLRLWADYVFGTQRAPNRRSETTQSTTSLWDQLDVRDRASLEMEQSKSSAGLAAVRLPKQKILALYGPSGVGKSSLARVAALQAGYNPVVIPLCEIQNVAELKSRLENATNTTDIDTFFRHLAISPSNTSATGARSPCFIIEDVDQASSEMIHFLCAWVRRSRGASSSSAVRRRPVICTCASLWNAPALRELRANALAVRVQQCNRERMQRRLEQICHSEGVHIGREQLAELLQTHGSDIRLCLNTLQFNSMTAKQTKTNTNLIANAGVAIDVPTSVNTAVTASIFTTLSAIFTLDFHEDNRGVVHPPSHRARTLLTLFGQLPHDDFTRLQQLVFNNFATVLKLSISQCLFVSSLFSQLDRLQNLIQRGQHFVLVRYPAFALLLVHFHCAVHVSRRLQFNLSALPFFDQQRENQQIVRSFRAGAAGGKHYINIGDLHSWLAPLLWLVLQPPVQPSQWSNGEAGQEQRQLLQRVVALMRSYRLQLTRNNALAEGVNQFTFEPAFDTLVRFPSQNSPTNPHLSPFGDSFRQYIAQQLESVQSIHQKDATEEGDQQGMESITAAEKGTPASLSSKDHFPLQSLRQQPSPSSTSSSSSLPLFTYKHSAGSSQAVRREILIGHLFLRTQHN